ncbi:MAG TPA: MBL fold metallo-hydrolase [Candidatus Acidoferrales bacterium]|nr:MBL fold metallo-hydrolase [Candidatus Acidoferrales bacterium]
MTPKSFSVAPAFLIAATTIAVSAATGVAPARARQDSAPEKSAVQLLQVQGRVHMLVGAGANVTIQLGDDAVVLVDTGLSQMSPQALAAIRTLSQKPIEFIINTSVDADHTGGNHNLSQSGHFISGLNGETPGASIVSQIAVLDRMTAASSSDPKESYAPQELWPTDTYDNDRWALFNDEAIVLEHPHAAHTDGDSLVFFRRSDVISAGDVFTPDRYPMIDLAKGGSINGEIDALNRLIEMMVPRADEEGGTYVVPGHGRICDRNAVTNYRDMATILRDRVSDDVKKGMTLDQVKASRPTLDYDGIYGSDSGPWTTQMFIEAVYKDLSAANRKSQSSQDVKKSTKSSPKYSEENR